MTFQETRIEELERFSADLMARTVPAPGPSGATHHNVDLAKCRSMESRCDGRLEKLRHQMSSLMVRRAMINAAIEHHITAREQWETIRVKVEKNQPGDPDSNPTPAHAAPRDQER